MTIPIGYDTIGSIRRIFIRLFKTIVLF